MVKFKYALFFILPLIVISCSNDKMKSQESVKKIITEDGVKVAYSYYPSDGEKGIILLHMLRRDRNDWNEFAQLLQSKGYSVISIDLRGHGESDGNWNEFSERDFNNMVLDVKATKELLAEKGISSFSIIGASIGANTALNYAVTDSEVKTVILLSPGLNYRGIKTEENIKNFKNPILIIVSEEDAGSFESSKKLHELATGTKELKIYQNAGHGTNMFVKEDLAGTVIEWLKTYS